MNQSHIFIKYFFKQKGIEAEVVLEPCSHHAKPNCSTLNNQLSYLGPSSGLNLINHYIHVKSQEPFITCQVENGKPLEVQHMNWLVKLKDMSW